MDQVYLFLVTTLKNTIPKAVYYARLLRFKNGPFCEFIFELPCTSVEYYARLYVKTSISLFSYCTETTHVYTTYQVPVPGIYSKQQFAAGTPIVLLYGKGDAVESSHGHHLPTCAVPPLRAQLADVVSTPSERGRYPDAGRARRVESIVSALY